MRIIRERRASSKSRFLIEARKSGLRTPASRRKVDESDTIILLRRQKVSSRIAARPGAPLRIYEYFSFSRSGAARGILEIATNKLLPIDLCAAELLRAWKIERVLTGQPLNPSKSSKPAKVHEMPPISRRNDAFFPPTSQERRHHTVNIYSNHRYE